MTEIYKYTLSGPEFVNGLPMYFHSSMTPCTTEKAVNDMINNKSIHKYPDLLLTLLAYPKCLTVVKFIGTSLYLIIIDGVI